MEVCKCIVGVLGIYIYYGTHCKELIINAIQPYRKVECSNNRAEDRKQHVMMKGEQA